MKQGLHQQMGVLAPGSVQAREHFWRKGGPNILMLEYMCQDALGCSQKYPHILCEETVGYQLHTSEEPGHDQGHQVLQVSPLLSMQGGCCGLQDS